MYKYCPTLLLLMLTCSQLVGCAVTIPYGLYEDKRLVDTIADDKATATSIKTDLMNAHFSDGWATSVYCYYGKVFLVGEVPPNMQGKAVEIARKVKGVRSITTHWFTALSSPENNLMLATKLRTNLIGMSGVSSTRIDTQVNSGRVVLLGVVNSATEKEKVILAAKDTSGVTQVTDYLMLPQ
ncbi:MAG: BON domain-containing protein [Desulfovibrionaceae bacterium]